ncbi:hypothetical protein PN478_18085 [Dolichospermum circinale CS-534/05]|uniref:hypothetical protein n=1 Tax=Dolichospermum circinale TaxID=109265 RepID=UPI00232DE370|nr:hypothetical protein [Dolichospermum circinale]MDB9453976.1 hypothetical protein [Dolichospermum circinale CS-541/06]MDB9463151.1 hypothetical protein [Dolichospermum circinale CS-541/04]MDB9492417.1 hypothetical protein [Dolichospermum circinale CS-534/05]MDB9548956.1 hypothetical protein [Dolichospermum circinale CS-1031]
MDPITTAVVAALANLSKDVIKDSYNALKDGLKKKLGNNSDLMDAIDKLEKNPNSEGRKATLQEEVQTAKVSDDRDILKLVQDLLDKISEQPGGKEIIKQTQTNTVTNVNVRGNFEFKPVQEGKKH